MTKRRERRIAALILLGYILVALLFSLGPIFEGPDEVEHYRFVRTLARTQALPDPYSQMRGEYHQAPLYYLLLTPISLLVNDPDFAQIADRQNPYYPYQMSAIGNDNKNTHLHSHTEEFPYTESGTALAIHLMRLVSIVLGSCTVLSSYAIFSLLWPNRVDLRLLALSVVAFMPQFLYLSSTVNNDNLLYLLSTLCLWVLCSWLRDGPSQRLALLLGVILGAVLLTKVSAVLLVFPVGVALLLDRRSWRYVPLIAIPLVVIAGWWYVRNEILYGDPTAVRVVLQTWSTESIRAGQVALDIGLGRLDYSYETFWARFGQGAIPVGEPIYKFFNLLTLAALTGIVVQVVQAVRNGLQALPIRLFMLVGTFALCWVAALVYYASTAWSGNQGRYLLPGVAAWGAIVAFGMSVWIPRRLRLHLALSSAALLSTIALICVLVYFLPAFRTTPIVSPPDRSLALRYGDVAELIGMSPATPKAHPGDVITVTLYWRSLRPAQPDLRMYLHSSNSDLIKRDSVPGNGNLPATDWQPGQTWAETFSIQVPDNIATQMTYPLLAGLYDAKSTDPLPATINGRPVTPTIGQIAIADKAQTIAPDYRFGPLTTPLIGLTQPRLTVTANTIDVCVRWLALVAQSTDYSVFVHLLDGTGSLITQADAQPKSGHYLTSVWTPGDAIDDCTTLTARNIGPGWRVALGLYNLDDGQRLLVQDRQGHTLPNNEITIKPN